MKRTFASVAVAVVAVVLCASAAAQKPGAPPPAPPAKQSLAPSVVQKLEQGSKRPLSPAERKLVAEAMKRRATAISAANDQFTLELQKATGLPGTSVKSILDNTFVPSNFSILDDTFVPGGNVSILDDTIAPPVNKSGK